MAPGSQGSLSGIHTSEEHLLGSLQSTPGTGWWEASSLPGGPVALSWPSSKFTTSIVALGRVYCYLGSPGSRVNETEIVILSVM